MDLNDKTANKIFGIVSVKKAAVGYVKKSQNYIGIFSKFFFVRQRNIAVRLYFTLLLQIKYSFVVTKTKTNI